MDSPRYESARVLCESMHVMTYEAPDALVLGHVVILTALMIHVYQNHYDAQARILELNGIFKTLDDKIKSDGCSEVSATLLPVLNMVK